MKRRSEPERLDAIESRLVQEIRVLAQCEDVRPIPHHWGYFTTPFGEVWSIRGFGKQPIARQPRKIKVKEHDGVKFVGISNDEKLPSYLTLIRVVALAFLGAPPFPDAMASAINGNPNDAHPDNVEWITHSRVLKKAIERSGPIVYGETQGGSKLTDEAVIQMRQRVAAGETTAEIAPDYGVTERVVRRAVRGQSWKHLPDPVSHPKRVLRGEQIALAQLTEADIPVIRSRYAAGESMSQIARDKQVSVSTINDIVKGKTWRHVK